MSANRTTVELFLDLGDLPPEPAEAGMIYLIDELAALGVLDVARKESGILPAGARASGSVELGALVIALGGAGATLPALIQLLHYWLQRRRSGTIRLKIGDDELEITGKVPDTVSQQALDAFLRRHER
jgi:hypothetical protein